MSRIGLLGILLLGTCACGAGSRALRPGNEGGRDELRIRLLTEGKKVIPARWSFDGLTATNTKLPDLVVVNEGDEPARLERVEIAGRAGGRELVRLAIEEEELAEVIAESGPKLKAAFSDPQKTERLQIRFGKTTLDFALLAVGAKLSPGQQLILPLAGMRFLDYVGKRAPEELAIEIAYLTERGPGRSSLRIPLTAYQAKGAYAFPLEQDRLIAINLPLNLTQHREMLSQEFAFDVVRIGFEGATVRTKARPKAAELSDYFIYRRDVRAVGDGTVVEAASRFPESEMADPSRYSEEFLSQLMTRLIPQIGFKNALAGNYLVIDHGNGEFSFYAHLSEVGKGVGERVARGEVIGKVGNTGNSTEPHLHFQLMDGPDFLTANSLPVAFTDVPAGTMCSNVTSANMVMSSDVLLLSGD